MSLLMVLSVHVFGQAKPNLMQLPNGVQYQIYTKGTADKIKLNDVITFNFTQKTDKDSVLFSSFAAGKPVTIAIEPSKSISDLMYFFPMLGLKDSALVKIPSDSLFKDGQMQRPSFFPPGSSLQFVLKIEKVQSMEAAMAERQKAMDIQAKMADSLKGNEQHILDAFIVENKLAIKQTPSGLRYLILTPSAKSKPVTGDTVEVNYIGRTLNGKTFDSSIEAEAKKAGLEQPGRNYEPISFVVGQGEVIPGWDEALLLMNEGSKGRFLIPSALAYGPQGAGQDIAPFSTLDFQVELVKVKPAIKGAALSKPAVVVKKGVSAKKTLPKTKPTIKKKVVTSKAK